ncbi:MAG: class I SAM-dependent methyltransferase [Dehalococcoidales bacterium]
MEINEGIRGRIQSFVKNLTRADDEELQTYISEILADKQFHGSIAGKGDDGSGKKPFSLKILASDTSSCLALYTLCRALKPTVVVETGVASGVSSAYILRALDKNNHGKLFSIDVPWYTVTGNWKADFTDEDMKVQPIEKQSGWIIHESLKGRWELLLGKTSDKLSDLLNKVGPVEVFFHDSEHSYENMSREFRTAWPALRKGGILIAHNVDVNNAFADFERSAGGESFRLSGINNDGRWITIGAKIKSR